MKYRRLSTDELAELEKEFIRYLAANGYSGPDWEQLKQDNSPRVDELIDGFSDLVFERVLTELEYLELRLPKDFRTYHCQADKMVVNGLLIEGNTSFDFRQMLDPEQMMSLLQISGAKVKLYSGERSYQTSREEELFQLMEGGARISKDGAMYKLLEGLKY